MSSVVESLSVGDPVASEEDLEAEVILKLCLHGPLDQVVSRLPLLDLAVFVEDSVAGLEIAAVAFEAASAAVIVEGMAEEEGALATKEVEASEVVGEVVMVGHPTAFPMVPHHLLMHLLVQVAAEAVYPVGMVAEVTADHP